MKLIIQKYEQNERKDNQLVFFIHTLKPIFEFTISFCNNLSEYDKLLQIRSIQVITSPNISKLFAISYSDWCYVLSLK